MLSMPISCLPATVGQCPILMAIPTVQQRYFYLDLNFYGKLIIAFYFCKKSVTWEAKSRYPFTCETGNK